MPNRPDRNHAIERLLREARPGPALAADGPCVTAEELAAWLDKGLPEAESVRVEAHLAACSTCQALLGAYASTESTQGAASRSWVRAAIPFAAAAVLVIGVWVAGTRWGGQPVRDTAVERQMARLEEPSAAPVQPAEPEKPEAPAARANQQSADLRDRDARADGPAATLERRVAVRSEAIDQSAAQERSIVPVAPPAASPPAEFRVVEVAPTAPAPQVAAGSRDAASADRAAASTEADRARQELAAAAPTPARARSEGFSSATARLTLPLAKSANAFSSPEGSWRWRIAGSALEVSADGGATWLPATGVTPGDLANVIGGVSPGAGVSWLVGRGGLVLVAADGRRFTRATVPAAATLTSVQAADASTADVQAADGRVWRTTNGGRAWTLVR